MFVYHNFLKERLFCCSEITVSKAKFYKETKIQKKAGGADQSSD